MPLTSRTKYTNITNSLLTMTGGGIIINNSNETNHPLLLLNYATVWDDLRIPTTSTKLGGASDPSFLAFTGTTRAHRFAVPPTENEVFFTMQTPHSYMLGSEIRPHVHWAPDDGNAGNVVWGLEYEWQNVGSAFAGTQTDTSVVAAPGVAKQHGIAAFLPIDGTGKNLSSMLCGRIWRESTGNTYGSTIWLLEIDFHIQSDTLGSREPFIK